MMIKEINNKEEWEGFLELCQKKTFLHSWNWAQFNKLMGNKFWRLGVYDEDELLAVCLVIFVKARRGNYLLVEHGPVGKRQAMEELLIYLKKLGQQEGVSFLRICPIWERTEENISIFRNLGFREAAMHEHPEVSWVLGLNKSEDELLMDMRKTTRYLIRQALKNSEIEIVKSRDLKDLEVFNRLYQKTVQREHFSPFSFDYLKNEFQSFREDNQILLLLGKYKNEVVAGAMVVFWQDKAFYHQGASLRKYAKIPVSYLLQWEAVKEAKARDLKHYSFWGIAPDDKPNHPWKGLTLFKKGFGGRKEEYVKTQDFIISKKYWLNYLVENFRKIKRGFR